MKCMKGPLVRKVAAVALCVLVTNLAMAEWPSRPSVRFDGETLVRGIFFNRGPVADLLPEVWQAPQLARYGAQMRTAKAIELQERILLRVINDDAAGVAIKVQPAYFGEQPLEQAVPGTFLKRFAADVQSGDRIRMQSAIREAAVRLDAAVRAESANNPRLMAGLRGVERDGEVHLTEPRSGERLTSSDDVTGNAIAVWFAVAVAVALVVAAVAVDVWYISHPDTASSSEARLRSETFVNLMAERLSH